MTDDDDRLSAAKWIFERTLGWIATADVKIGAAIAIDSAMLGGLAAAFAGSEHHVRTAWVYLFVCTGAAGMMFALFCAGFALFPRMDGPKTSMIFFGKIIKMDEATYIERFMKLSSHELLADLSAQIYRNSQIACDKHHWVRKSLIWSFFSATLMVPAIALLVKG